MSINDFDYMWRFTSVNTFNKWNRLKAEIGLGDWKVLVNDGKYYQGNLLSQADGRIRVTTSNRTVTHNLGAARVPVAFQAE